MLYRRMAVVVSLSMHNSEPDVRRPIAPSLDESGGVRRSLKCLPVDTPVRPDPSAVSWVNPRLDPGEERRVVTGIPGKTGVVYTLDRETGEFL